ncbi:hypothetical protein [Brevundimonas sp. UBA7534]|uniref:hypothetical protein n=1 Tax=Brevundimonas sp. UBA7534 TaxID=1946138 RepID=UPI0025BB2ADC|nr:hypothetical protein [Brevundimonas sp. UBA7534]
MSAEPVRPFAWNGPNGDLWVANQARLDRMLRPFGEALLAATAPAIGERVLDVGCGAGACGRAVGPSGGVLGVDISEALIALTERPEPVRRRAMDAVRQAFARKVTPAGVVIDGAAWIVTARRA